MSPLSERPQEKPRVVRGWARPQPDEPAADAGASSPMTVWVKVRLTKALGSTRADQVFADTMQRMKGGQLDSPQQLLEFAEILIAQGGLVMTVGCTFKVHATLRGASSTP